MIRRWMAAVLVCLFALLVGVPSVYADKAQRNDLSGTVEFLRQEDDRYVLQVTAANAGEDFSGAVRLMFASNYTEGCAYDTELTLPKGGQKQFALTIPKRGLDNPRITCVMSFLDEKGRTLQSLTLKNVFGNARTGIGLGILSDNYDDLTYLDLGGASFDLWNESAPIGLVKLDADNMAAYLSGLYFLVIDRFDVASLGEENIRLIQDWVRDGGWLLIGTGEYGEQTLGGFDGDFFSLQVGAVSLPGEENYHSYETYWDYQDAGIDVGRMAFAEVVGTGGYSPFVQYWEQPCLIADIGDGAVGVFAVSLGDPELKKGNRSLYSNMLELVMIRSNSYSSSSGRSDMDYLGRSALARIDHENTNVDFSWLKLLIGAYVVAVGPVLYLILRKCKRSEWYWLGAPLLGVTFIVLVFFFGRGLRMTETKVYSVSVQRVDGNWQDTYYIAYRSGTKPWNLRLADGYEIGGIGFGGGSYYSAVPGDYHYLVRKDSEGLSIGMKPTENFESGYLYAGGRTEREGAFACEGLAVPWDLNSIGGGIAGKVTNYTDEDLSYLAVLAPNGTLMIFSDVKAGETLELAQAVGTPRCIYSEPYGTDVHSLYYDLNGRRDLHLDDEEKGGLMALYIGLGLTGEGTVDVAIKPGTASYETSVGTWGAANGTGTLMTTRGTAQIVGLTKNAAGTVTSRCEEKAYRCLYAYAEMEVEGYVKD